MSIRIDGLKKEQVKNLIQGRADAFADMLRAKGFDVRVEHSGSAAGPSSYVKISDPTTGRYIARPVRFSNHSKGVFESVGVLEIVPGHFDEADGLRMAEEMRAQGPTEHFLAQQEAEKLARQKTIDVGLARLKKGKSLTRTQEQYLTEEGLLG